MEKRRRSLEENNRISIATIALLVVILITGIFLLIYLLFAKAENEKRITSLNNETETTRLDTNILKEKQDELYTLLDNVSDATKFINIQKEKYISEITEIEARVKNYDSEGKIAYLTFVVDKTDNLDKTLEILNDNKVIATFFTKDKEAADKIINNGHFVGIYVDDEKVIDNFKEEYKDIINAYNPDLFMISPALKEKEIKIDSFYEVKENSTSEGKQLLNRDGYIKDIVETTADRDFLKIKVNLSNAVGISAIDGIISQLKDKNYMFLPIVSSSSEVEK